MSKERTMTMYESATRSERKNKACACIVEVLNNADLTIGDMIELLDDMAFRLRLQKSGVKK